MQRLLNYLAFQSFGFECAWWSLFQKRVVLTELDIYGFFLLVMIYNKVHRYEITNTEQSHILYCIITIEIMITYRYVW